MLLRCEVSSEPGVDRLYVSVQHLKAIEGVSYSLSILGFRQIERETEFRAETFPTNPASSFIPAVTAAPYLVPLAVTDSARDFHCPIPCVVEKLSSQPSGSLLMSHSALT